MTADAVERHGEEYRLQGRSPDDRSAEWEWAIEQAYVPLAIKVDGVERDESSVGSAVEGIRRIDLEDIALVDIHCGPCSVARSRSRISRDDHDYIAILLNLAGEERVATLLANGPLPAGAVAVWDTKQTARFEVGTALVKRTLLIPRDVIREAVGPKLDLPAAPILGVRARLLAGFLDVVSQNAASLSHAERRDARNATLDLIAGLVRSNDVACFSGDAAALLPQIDRWLERNLHRPLVPVDIAAAHGVSVRTLHRLYRASGKSVGEVLRRRRLYRAREDLVRTAEPVSVIAHRWLFSDASHFGRVFRQEFGCAPGEYRATFNGRGIPPSA
jgi:AraC-like DNA-binding protein